MNYLGIQIRKLVDQLIPSINSNLNQKGPIMQNLMDSNMMDWTRNIMTQTSPNSLKTRPVINIQAWSTKPAICLVLQVQLVESTTPLKEMPNITLKWNQYPKWMHH